MAVVRPPRNIAPRELAVVTSALQHASTGLLRASDLDLSGLLVISRRDCGCASVDFATCNSRRPKKVLADGLATTTGNKSVGVIVWGDEAEVAGLEIYSLEDDDLSLPSPLSITSWETAGRKKLR